MDYKEVRDSIVLMLLIKYRLLIDLLKWVLLLSTHLFLSLINFIVFENLLLLPYYGSCSLIITFVIVLMLVGKLSTLKKTKLGSFSTP